MEKRRKNSTKKGLNNPHTNEKLTKTEEEVLDLITIEFLTIKKIALRRKCSLQAVYKIIKKLKEKGALNKSLKKVENFQSSKVENNKRLHSQELNIKILWQDNRYKNHLKKSNIRFIDGHTIRLYRNSIEIYAGEGTSFWGETEQRATAISLRYWDKFLGKLSNLLDLILVKPRSENIRLVAHHYGNIHCDFAKDCNENKQRIRIFAKEDGKLWFDMDESFNLKEREHPHKETAKQDSELVSIHIDDWRNNNPPTNSQLATHIKSVTDNQLIFAENMKSHIEAIQTLSREVKRLSKVFKNTITENKKLKMGNQSTLNNFI